MRSTIRLAAAPLLVACSLLVGCASPPAALRFHSLLSAEPGGLAGRLPGARPAPNAAGRGPVRLTVAPVSVPAALDQPQWLVRRSDGSLQLLEQDRWASPLADELRAALREGLAERWGVVEGGVPAPAPLSLAWRLVVDLQRLDTNPGRDSLLQARWTLLPPQRDQAPISCSFRVREPVQTLDTLALAEAHRLAVQRLADDIGSQLTRWEAGDRSRQCSGPPTSS